MKSIILLVAVIFSVNSFSSDVVEAHNEAQLDLVFNKLQSRLLDKEKMARIREQYFLICNEQVKDSMIEVFGPVDPMTFTKEKNPKGLVIYYSLIDGCLKLMG
ncbi:MAG: hypothetical protein V2I33_16290, partial [Kangiellaceae bacterium]|nr:hypothetical protein [Kangiellaceae bacterium]